MRIDTSKFWKTLLAVTCCFVVTSGYGQTKEETIDWLKEKFEKYLISNFHSIREVKLISITPCEMKIKYGAASSDAYNYNTITFPIKGMSISQYGHPRNKKEVIKDDITLAGNSYTTYSSTIVKIKIRDGEENIYERINKAIDHLATFCSQQKETF